MEMSGNLIVTGSTLLIGLHSAYTKNNLNDYIPYMVKFMKNSAQTIKFNSFREIG